MSIPVPVSVRTVTRVSAKQRLGPDAQVDDKALIIAPGDPSLTDPFLLLSEDWFSSPGFEWHPQGAHVTVDPGASADPTSDSDVDSALHLAVPDRDARATVMIYSGRPIGEPVAFGGPFVMNDQNEIAAAFRDFHAGRFGEVPRQARLTYDR
jgi:redox-sensitive bicupin YhaK (pirin superfamily)